VANASQGLSSGQTYHLKEKGVVTDNSRAMAHELVNHLGVPIKNVNNVIQAVAKPLGITVNGKISTQSVSQAVLEGGVAAKLQLVQEFQNTDSVYFSTFAVLVAKILTFFQVLLSQVMAPHIIILTMNLDL